MLHSWNNWMLVHSSLLKLVCAIFKRKISFLVISKELYWKKIKLYFPFFYELLFLLELPRAAGLLKASCFGEMNLFNRDNARDADAVPGEWGIQGSEPTNPTQSKINIVLIFLKMILKNTSPLIKYLKCIL